MKTSVTDVEEISATPFEVKEGSEEKFVVKRNLTRELLNPGKLFARIDNIVSDIIDDQLQRDNNDDHLNYVINFLKLNPVRFIVSATINIVSNNIPSNEIDNIAAKISSECMIDHFFYDYVATRIALTKLYKETKSNFSEVMDDLYNSNIITEDFYRLTQQNNLDDKINHYRDFKFPYFGFKTLEKSYLLRINGKIVERPQHMFMRIALGLNKSSVSDCINTYTLLSNLDYTHGSPTIFNMGTYNRQYASCFLLTFNDDKLQYFKVSDLINKCIKITLAGGGIGLDLNSIQGCYLTATLAYLDTTIEFTKQIATLKRTGGIAVYIEAWHVNIYEFVNGKCLQNINAHRNLFFGLFIPDLFMKRWRNDKDWCLFDPVTYKDLHLSYGEEFEKLYETYEKKQLYTKKIRARELWCHILRCSLETGGPYLIYKDACNIKNNQKNAGVILTSNLCTEIMEITSEEEIAVCNLASVSLPSCIKSSHPPLFDYQKLREIVHIVTKNLNSCIFESEHSFKESFLSNIRHRPIGIGVQGLADVFGILRHSYDSVEAKEINKNIFETIYYAALETSCELVEKYGTYETYTGSPVSNGILQMDFWNTADNETKTYLWDWKILREKIKRKGLCNSLLTTVMPTASTAQILGNQESVEPFVSNIFYRRVSAGEYRVVNKYLMQDLMKLELWNYNLRDQILSKEGSIAEIMSIPDELKGLYKTVWEIKQKILIDLAIDRQSFIDQSQSLNLYFEAPTFSTLSSVHYYTWVNGLKTGMYYLRQKPTYTTAPFVVPLKYYNLNKNDDDHDHENDSQIIDCCSDDTKNTCENSLECCG